MIMEGFYSTLMQKKYLLRFYDIRVANWYPDRDVAALVVVKMREVYANQKN